MLALDRPSISSLPNHIPSIFGTLNDTETSMQDNFVMADRSQNLDLLTILTADLQYNI